MPEYALTTGQYLQARRIKAHKPATTARHIAAQIGATEAQVRKALDEMAPKYRPKPRPSAKPHRADLDHGPNPRTIAGIGDADGPRVPREVLIERERRLAMVPRSLTAAVFGDPPPGHREYLDSLAAQRNRR